MGLTAIVSSAASAASSASSSSASSAASASTSVASLTSPVGLGIGGVFVAAALIVLLAYFDVVDATEEADTSVRTTVVAAFVPLVIAFVGVVAFHTLAIL